MVLRLEEKKGTARPKPDCPQWLLAVAKFAEPVVSMFDQIDLLANTLRVNDTTQVVLAIFIELDDMTQFPFERLDNRKHLEVLLGR